MVQTDIPFTRKITLVIFSGRDQTYLLDLLFFQYFNFILSFMHNTTNNKYMNKQTNKHGSDM